MSRLLTIVPTRGRPLALSRVVGAWYATGAQIDADLLFACDDDDPALPHYRAALDRAGRPPHVRLVTFGPWQAMVPKLNAAVAGHAHGYTAVGFAGDDHLPRTPGWPALVLAELDRHGGGIVHGDDKVWAGTLPTEWTMSANIVEALGRRLVPADVEHLYSDNAVAELGRAAGCLHYLPSVVIEHMHPSVGKADSDAGYAAVNSAEQYRRDEEEFVRWRALDLPRQVEIVREVLSRGAATG